MRGLNDSTSFTNTKRTLIDSIETGDMIMKERKMNLIEEYCDNIFHNVPINEKNKFHIFSFEYNLLSGNTKQNYRQKFSQLDRETLNKWIDYRLNVLKNWEKVRDGMLVNKSTMEIMCFQNLINDVGKMVNFEGNLKLYTKDVLRLLVNYYLGIPYYKSDWNQTHKHIFI